MATPFVLLESVRAPSGLVTVRVALHDGRRFRITLPRARTTNADIQLAVDNAVALARPPLPRSP